MNLIGLKQLIAHLDILLQPSLISDSCPNGLQVQGAPGIGHIGTAVSASLETIQRAVDLGVQTLIVHHGLFWTGDNFEIVGSKREKLSLLLLNNISLLAYHLPLDLHKQYGNNWRAAQEMGWTELEPFGMYRGIPIGVRGTFSSCSVKDFQWKLEEYYEHPATCALGGNQIISSAALVSGGAYKSLQEAAAADVDCFITGNFDEPAWHQAFEEKINFFAMGHSATERIGPRALGEHLQDHFQVKTTFIDVSNPF